MNGCTAIPSSGEKGWPWIPLQIHPVKLHLKREETVFYSMGGKLSRKGERHNTRAARVDGKTCQERRLPADKSCPGPKGNS